jgi:hypothetical protein
MGRFLNGNNIKDHNIFGKKELSLWTRLGISKGVSKSKWAYISLCVNTVSVLPAPIIIFELSKVEIALFIVS